MNRLLYIVPLLSLIQTAEAQTTAEYLSLRKKSGIVLPVGIEALEAFVGTKVIEIKGLVKGNFKTNGRYSLLVERTDGETEFVDADLLPEWLEGNDVPARLMLRASRETENSPLKAKLVAAAPESVIAQIDHQRERAELQRKAAAVKKSQAAKKPAPPKKGDWILPVDDVTPIYASFIQRQNRRLTWDQAQHIAQGIIGFSLRYGVDARLIMAMVMVESGFNPSATSRSGAMGLGQLMPGTAKGMGVNNAYDSMQNLYGTVKVVRGHLEKYSAKTGDAYKSLVLTLAAYNAGPGAVKRHGGVPPYRETQNYVRKVTSLYSQFTRR